MASLGKREVRRRSGIPQIELLSTVGFSPAAGAANVCNVTITPKNVEGTTIAGVRVFDIYLSDSATGAGLTATTASGTVTATTGADIVDITAKKYKKVSNAVAGTIVLAITDTAKTGFYVILVDPMTGKAFASSQLITANYG